MQAIQIYVDNGILRLPPDVSLPPRTRLVILAVTEEELSNAPDSREIAKLMELSGALDFLHDEPDIYTDEDILPGRRNPRFRGT